MMKHILGMASPRPGRQGTRIAMVELDYLRLIYAVSETRKPGENAQGYFVVADNAILRRLCQLERSYHAEEYARLIGISLLESLGCTVLTAKTEALSAMVKAAILDENADPVSFANWPRDVRGFVLAEAILGLEPGVRQVKDENRFPFGIPMGCFMEGQVSTGRDLTTVVT